MSANVSNLLSIEPIFIEIERTNSTGNFQNPITWLLNLMVIFLLALIAYISGEFILRKEPHIGKIIIGAVVIYLAYTVISGILLGIITTSMAIVFAQMRAPYINIIILLLCSLEVWF